MSMPNQDHTSSPTEKILEFKIDIPGKSKINEPMNAGIGLQTPIKTINMNMSIPQSVETLACQNLGETLKRLGDGPNQEEDDMVFIDQTLLNY